MSEGTRTARLRYREPVLRAAVRAFMLRRVLRRARFVVPVAILSAALAANLALGGSSFVSGAVAAALLAAAMTVAALWRARSDDVLGRLRAMDPPDVDLSFDADGLTVSSNLGEARLPWARFTEVWELPGALALFTAPNAFMTLPADGLSPDDLAALRSHLPASTRG